MAALEQLEIHSRSYLVRWINVSGAHTISWSLQPHKKSLNFGIFKHPGTSSLHAPHLPNGPALDSPGPLDGPSEGSGTRPRSGSRANNTRVVEKLQGVGMKSVSWTGKCEAEKVTMGMYDVPEGEGGMYALVFDNTFSKQVSKTATFVLMTYPTNSPPKNGHHLRYSETTAASTTSLGGKHSPSMRPVTQSSDSLPQDSGMLKPVAPEGRPKTSYAVADPGTVGRMTFHTGILHKKRRKRNQGHAKRFFSLDFATSTLSYYKDRHSSAIRGSIPLSLAVIAMNEKNRVITIDSGAEVWHLRASNQEDFENWRYALETASQTTNTPLTPVMDRSTFSKTTATSSMITEQDSRDWSHVEALVGRVSGTRDAVRRLAKDTDPKYRPSLVQQRLNERLNPTASPSPSESESVEYFPEEKPEKTPFWKRKASRSSPNASAIFQRSVSAQLAVPSPSAVSPLPGSPNILKKKSSQNLRASNHSQQHLETFHEDEEDVHNRCMEILRDLDTLVFDFSNLLSDNKQRRNAALQNSVSRRSIDSFSSEEFFDATDGDAGQSQLLTIRRDSAEDGDSRSEPGSDDGGSESSDDEGLGILDRKAAADSDSTVLPPKPQTLDPLPLEKVSRRSVVPPPKVAPPSLIAFLRKNVGKDLSTIAMPVSANEPTSLLQRLAEQMEYSELLDSAVKVSSETGERILHVTAFALSSFSNSRVKERAIRKPYNPMLGETYELVREDKGFRFIAEKISHRPVRMACQAEGRDWTFLQSPMPVQKFWGKSAELNTDGRARLLLRIPSSGSTELYSWTIATSFLRNVIAGEKYVEPVGTMTVHCETTGVRAVATFKAGGMFAGRSEEVSVQAFAANGTPLSLGLAGRWTASLSFTGAVTPSKAPLWQTYGLADPKNPTRCYGFTAFAAQLNEVTPVEAGHLPATDTRLRPDQRAHEEGDLDRAEGMKARLEERQRARRRVMEEHNETWSPRWFVKAKEGENANDGDAIWRLKTGSDGYWEERSKGEFTNVLDVFQG